MLRSISFQNYKAFHGRKETVEVRPITLVIGKNSSGKSSILKLFPMFANMLSGALNYPLALSNMGISLGAEYSDLFHNGGMTDLKFGLTYDDFAISATYFINNGVIEVSDYVIKKDGGEFGLSLNQDKSELHGLIHRAIMDGIGIDLSRLCLNVNYIGPFRVIAPHNVVFKGFDNTLQVGYDGRGAYNILLNSYRSDKLLFNNVANWMEQNLEGQRLEFSNAANNSGTFNLLVKKDGYLQNLTNVGQGVAQVIPVITQSYMSQENSINILEQPVLHLHPAAHSCVAYRLGQSAKENNCSYIIESHSENILLGFRHLVVNPKVDFGPEDIIIYFIKHDNDGAYLDPITINENGDLSSWPTGVFSEGFELLRSINRMRK